jgi:hypothetical protein
MNFSRVLAISRRWLLPQAAFEASPQTRAGVASLAETGRNHLAAARMAVDQRMFLPAAALYGHGIGSFLQAKRLLADPENGGAGAVAPAEFVAASPFGSTDAGRDALLLLREQPIDGPRRSRRCRKALAGLHQIAATLAVPLYPATDGDVRRLQMRRGLAVGLFLLVAVVGIGHWLTAPRNVARGKRVTASSVRFGSPQGLVNGAIEWGTFGLHTGSGRAWATIDLGDFYSLAYAEIYGRGDGRFEFNLPLTVDLSDDGTTFRAAGACAEIFTQATPCVVNLAHQRARFVRVSADEVVLSEVEVYAAP